MSPRDEKVHSVGKLSTNAARVCVATALKAAKDENRTSPLHEELVRRLA